VEEEAVDVLPLAVLAGLGSEVSGGLAGVVVDNAVPAVEAVVDNPRSASIADVASLNIRSAFFPKMFLSTIFRSFACSTRRNLAPAAGGLIHPLA